MGMERREELGGYGEVSQKEKDKYCILSSYTESRKMVLKNLFTEQQWRNRHRD